MVGGGYSPGGVCGGVYGQIPGIVAEGWIGRRTELNFPNSYRWALPGPAVNVNQAGVFQPLEAVARGVFRDAEILECHGREFPWFTGVHAGKPLDGECDVQRFSWQCGSSA